MKIEFRFNQIATATLVVSALLTGCAQTSKISALAAPASAVIDAEKINSEIDVTDSPNTKYQFADAIYDGYWAMSSTINDAYIVMKFSEDYARHYQFKCFKDGSFKEVYQETMNLLPTESAVGLRAEDDDEAWSNLKIERIMAKQYLTLLQQFNDNTSKSYELYPHGIVFNYKYSPTLTPLCSKKY